MGGKNKGVSRFKVDATSLKKCFCGGIPQVQKYGKYRIECPECGKRTHSYDNPEQAIAEWNARLF